MNDLLNLNNKLQQLYAIFYKQTHRYNWNRPIHIRFTTIDTNRIIIETTKGEVEGIRLAVLKDAKQIGVLTRGLGSLMALQAALHSMLNCSKIREFSQPAARKHWNAAGYADPTNCKSSLNGFTGCPLPSN